MDPSVYSFDYTKVNLNTTSSRSMSDITATTTFRDFECTFETCSLNYSYWHYRPAESVNLAFAVLFGISALTYLVQGIFSKKQWLGFTITMVSGCVLEFIGYAGRVMAYNDLFHETPFLIQIICLTIAPAFLAAGIYLCLARIVRIFGVANSRLKPRIYPFIFITCDVISLALQATGGGIASVKTHQGEDTTFGDNIMIAGLGFQVFTMFVFIILALDFAVCTVRKSRQPTSLAALETHDATLRKLWICKGFLVALSLSTLCIFTRCVFRVAELSNGWQGHLMKKQHYFIGLEGAVVVVAVFMLNMFHPGLCLRERTRKGKEADAWMCFGRKERASRESSTDEVQMVEQNRTIGMDRSCSRGIVTQDDSVLYV